MPNDETAPTPPVETPAEVDDAEDEPCEPIMECLDPEVQQRLWIKTLTPLLQIRSLESDPSGRVQLALDLLFIAVCERLVRILRSDLDAVSA